MLESQQCSYFICSLTSNLSQRSCSQPVCQVFNATYLGCLFFSHGLLDEMLHFLNQPGLHSLKLTANAPEKLPSQKERIVFQRSFFRGENVKTSRVYPSSSDGKWKMIPFFFASSSGPKNSPLAKRRALFVSGKVFGFRNSS